MELTVSQVAKYSYREYLRLASIKNNGEKYISLEEIEEKYSADAYSDLIQKEIGSVSEFEKIGIDEYSDKYIKPMVEERYD